MISLTPTAVGHIRKFRQEAGNSAAGLRVSVVGGGCSGLSYKLDFQQSPQANDKIFQYEDILVFVDPKSILFIKGMLLDYDGSLNGKGFIFNNPMADKMCGCGTSFSV